MDIDEITTNMSFLDDWEDRYRYLIELGGQLEPVAEAERTSANKVDGCMSQVWLVTTRVNSDTDPVLNYRGASDAMIVQGLIALLIALYSGRRASEIGKLDALLIFEKIGLGTHLSKQRANGLRAMVSRIRAEASALTGTS
jgi:cysteine desulfuration protein SufE